MVLVDKELRQLMRDPVLLIVIGWLYTIEVVLCAYALSFDLQNATLAVRDRDRTPTTRALVDHLERSRYFRVVYVGDDDRAWSRVLQRGTAIAQLDIPSGWTRSVLRGGQAPLQLLVDGSNTGVAATARGYLERILQQHVADVAATQIGRAPPVPPVESRSRIWYNADLKTVYFVMISMIALAALLVGVIYPSASLVREREAGTLEQMMVTPMQASELVLAKLLVTFLVNIAGVTLSLGLVPWFRVPLRGSLWVFYGTSAVFLISSMGIGVLIASVSRNLQQALLLSFFGLIPVMFLSGTLVPIESMPPLFQQATLLSPLRHYMDCLVGVFLKGTGWRELWPQVLAMAAIGTAFLALSLARLRSRMA